MASSYAFCCCSAVKSRCCPPGLTRAETRAAVAEALLFGGKAIGLRLPDSGRRAGERPLRSADEGRPAFRSRAVRACFFISLPPCPGVFTENGFGMCVCLRAGRQNNHL